MKKNIILAIIGFMFLSAPVFAQSQTSKALSRIENTLYGIEYTKQSDVVRLERIEETVYGEKKDGNIKTRLSKLNEDVSTNQMGEEITAKRDTFEEQDEEIITEDTARTAKNQSKPSDNNYFYDDYEEKEDANIEYPIINELEKMAFKKEYKEMEIKKRIFNLEKELLNKTYQNENLANRVERLKNKVAYNPAQKTENVDTYSYYNDDGSSINADDYYAQYHNNYFSSKNLPQTVAMDNDFTISDDDISDRDFRAKLNKIEKNVLSQSYSNDSNDMRLSRLEGMIFNTTFSKDSDVARLNRLSSATKAQKTAKKYDSNAFQQKVAAALQIGMFVLMVVAMIL